MLRIVPTTSLTIVKQEDVASHLEETEVLEGSFPNDEKTQRYGNLLFLLQSEPRHIAHLCRLVNMNEIDSLLHCVMFTIYGNQYESREEHLLLTMFQVRLRSGSTGTFLTYSSAVRPDLAVRQYTRVLISAARKYSSFANDDNIHSKRTRSELSQGCSSRTDKCFGRA